MDYLPLITPCVSVLMSVHNGEPFLREAVDSILNQTFTDFEFLIFDDCSTDNTLVILQSYDDQRIRIIINEQNIGLTESLNKGLALARGELVARMDADDISVPARLAKQVAFLDQHPEIALVGSWMECIDDKGRMFSQVTMPTEPQEIYTALLKKNCFAHPSVLFRKEAILAVGGYQNRSGKYAQDYDLWLRLSNHYLLANLPEYLIQYRFHAEQVSLKKLRAQTKSAQQYRILAAKSRAEKNGELVNADAIKGLSMIDQLKGVEGSYGKSYFRMANNYKSIEEKKLARKSYFTSLLCSPLSIQIWDKVLLDILFNRFLNQNQKKAIRWYGYRLKNMLIRRQD